MKLFSRRDDTMTLIGKRLAEIESTYESVRDADPAQTHERLLRLRYGSSEQGQRAGGH